MFADSTSFNLLSQTRHDEKMFSLLTSLILSTFISLVGFSSMFGPVNFGRACVVGETCGERGCAEKCTTLVIFYCEVLEQIRLTIF